MEDYFDCNGGGRGRVEAKESRDFRHNPTIILKSMSEFRNSDAGKEKKKKKDTTHNFFFILIYILEPRVI